MLIAFKVILMIVLVFSFGTVIDEYRAAKVISNAMVCIASMATLVASMVWL